MTLAEAVPIQDVDPLDLDQAGQAVDGRGLQVVVERDRHARPPSLRPRLHGSSEGPSSTPGEASRPYNNAPGAVSVHASGPHPVIKASCQDSGPDARKV